MRNDEQTIFDLWSKERVFSLLFNFFVIWMDLCVKYSKIMRQTCTVLELSDVSSGTMVLSIVLQRFPPQMVTLVAPSPKFTFLFGNTWSKRPKTYGDIQKFPKILCVRSWYLI